MNINKNKIVAVFCAVVVVALASPILYEQYKLKKHKDETFDPIIISETSRKLDEFPISASRQIRRMEIRGALPDSFKLRVFKAGSKRKSAEFSAFDKDGNEIVSEKIVMKSPYQGAEWYVNDNYSYRDSVTGAGTEIIAFLVGVPENVCSENLRPHRAMPKLLDEVPLGFQENTLAYSSAGHILKIEPEINNIGGCFRADKLDAYVYFLMLSER